MLMPSGIKLNVFMPRVTITVQHVQCHYAECRYAECYYAECPGAKKHLHTTESVHFPYITNPYFLWQRLLGPLS